jgi:histidinol-phosphate aminotransferase
MATLFGARTVEVDDPGFAHDLDAMAAAVTPQTKEIFVANPNNPTGTLLSQAEIDRFMEKVPPQIVVVFDEAYYEFLDDPPDTLKFVREGRNVIVLRTFSKIQGLANLRIGYGLAPAELITVLQKTRQPFQRQRHCAGGRTAGLEDDEHQRKTREITRSGRERLQRAICGDETRVCPEPRQLRPGEGGRWKAHLPGAASARDHRARYGRVRFAGMDPRFHRNARTKRTIPEGIKR